MTDQEIIYKLLGIIRDITDEECCCYNCDLCEITHARLQPGDYACENLEQCYQRLREV